MLNIVEALPEGFIDMPPEGLLALLGGPTLIHLKGRHEAPLFVSVLLHGNEPTGLYAIQDVLRRYQGDELPRSLSIFVGNVYAAAKGMRRLSGQLDYNRVWSLAADAPEYHMMQCVLNEMQQRNVYASIDVHNNTGLNPHYACLNRLDAQYLQLAAMFGRTVVYFTKPDGVQSMALASLCPAVTLECGQPGQKYGEQHAAEFIDSCLRLSEIPNHPVAPQDIDLFHTVAIVKVPAGTTFAFEPGGSMEFLENVDHYNFSELAPGTQFGWVHDEHARLECQGENGEDLGSRYFSYDQGEIRLVRSVMPSMLTLDKRVIEQDCFCYLMERFGVGE